MYCVVLLCLLLGLGRGARRPPPPPNVTCEWHFTNKTHQLVLFFDDLKEDSPLHATTAVCSTTTLLPNDVQRSSDATECLSLRAANRVEHVASFLTTQEPPHPKTVRLRRITHPAASSAAVVVAFRPLLCEPLHALLEIGAMLRITNGRLFWSWAGRDSAHSVASPRVAKSSSALGDFEMRFPVLCSHVRSRQTYMKGQPGMHKYAYRSEVAPGVEYFSGGESEHKMKVWISHRTSNVRYVFLYTWMNKALYYRTNPAWSLCHFRTFFASTGGAMAEVGNVPPTDPKYLRSDYRKDRQALARWTNERLALLAQQSGHPELAHAPVIFWGWSRDGMQATSFAEAVPSRTLGAVRYMSAQHESERGFDFEGSIAHIPFLLTMADSDYMAGMDNVNFLRKGRVHGAPWVCAIMRHSTHGMNQDKFGLLFPWILSLLEQLPADTSPYTSPPPLRRPNTTSGWLGNMDKVTAVLTDKGAWRSSTNDNDFAVGPVGNFLHPSASASWFRTAALARLWRDWNIADSATVQVIAGIVTCGEVKEGGPIPAVITIVRPPYSSSITVAYSLQGTAAEGQDFEPVERQVTIPGDSSAADVLIFALEDLVPEEAETVELVLEAPAGYQLMETVPLVVVIHDSTSSRNIPPVVAPPSWEDEGIQRSAPVGTTSMPTVPPADVCAVDCGAHGRCSGERCECDAGWQGPRCQECAAPECSSAGDGPDGAMAQDTSEVPSGVALPRGGWNQTNGAKPTESNVQEHLQADDEKPRPRKLRRREVNKDDRAPAHSRELAPPAIQPSEEGKFVDAKSEFSVTMDVGQCEYKGGVVTSAARGKALEECRSDLLAAHQRDAAVDGAEISLDSRRLCWIITGARGIRHPLSPNPKFRCLRVSAGQPLPTGETVEKEEQKEKKEEERLTEKEDASIPPVWFLDEALPPMKVDPPSPRAAGAPNPIVAAADPFAKLAAPELVMDDWPATNPVITVVGYTVGGLLVLLAFRGYCQSRRRDGGGGRRRTT
eukprot:GGOE01001113.1.p1 GENE.GGOE01001113.1~~GGOE01001113.1.p1  ORF type:complete len:1004 (+),score=192.70 GGOE01001113.1:54-3065(+)